jgi:hypothetical protein
VRSAPTRPAPDAARLELAAMLVRRAALPPGTDEDRAAVALARTFGKHPPGSKHAALVGAALQPRSPQQKRQGPRPPEQVAVRRLLARGEPAYPAAVVGEQERRFARALSRTIRREQTAERLRPLVDGDGPAVVADLTADHQRHTGQPPPCSWLAPRVAGRFRITLADAWALVHLLNRDSPS